MRSSTASVYIVYIYIDCYEMIKKSYIKKNYIKIYPKYRSRTIS